MHFQRQDMDGTQYVWDEDPKVAYLGQPTRRLFDRYNGPQVLFIINFYGSISEQFTLREGRMIEHAIQNFLPLDVKSEISVFNWLREAGIQVKNESNVI